MWFQSWFRECRFSRWTILQTPNRQQQRLCIYILVETDVVVAPHLTIESVTMMEMQPAIKISLFIKHIWLFGRFLILRRFQLASRFWLFWRFWLLFVGIRPIGNRLRLAADNCVIHERCIIWDCWNAFNCNTGLIHCAFVKDAPMLIS